MILHQTKFRVKYSDTDQMGFMHHSNYARYYENARWATFRSIGLPYSEIESADVLMPVVEMETKFYKPAFYDEEIVITTEIKEKPKARMLFYCQMFSSNNEVINQAVVKLAFIDKATKRALRPPKFLLAKLDPYFASNTPISGGKFLAC